MAVPDLPAAVCVYGAGSFGHGLADALERAGVRVAAVADRDPGRGSGSRTYVGVDEAAGLGLPVLLGICNPGVDLRGVVAELRMKGVADVRTPVTVARELARAGVPLTNYWLTGDIAVYELKRDEIDSARDRLLDPRSRDVFDAVLAYRTTGDAEALTTPDPLVQQYFPDDLPFETTGMRYIDAGAFDGDTIRALRERGSSVEALIALEPDAANFARASRELRHWERGDAVCLPLALGERSEMLRFDASGSASASASSDGDGWVQSVSLDSIAGAWRPTHVKMDIEGAEYSAIVGMQEILRHYRPRLAVSVYHRPDDHWRILHLLDRMDLGYRFWMRTYGEQTFDTVLYCATDEGPTATRVKGTQ